MIRKLGVFEVTVTSFNGRHAFAKHKGTDIVLAQIGMKKPVDAGKGRIRQEKYASGRNWGREPKPGDRIIVTNFIMKPGGYVAETWCYADELEEAKSGYKVTATLTAPADSQAAETGPMYRYMVQRGPKKIGRLTPYGFEWPTVQWSGRDLAKLRREFPKKHNPIVDVDDFRNWFEVLDGSEWKRTQDPR